MMKKRQYIILAGLSILCLLLTACAGEPDGLADAARTIEEQEAETDKPEEQEAETDKPEGQEAETDKPEEQEAETDKPEELETETGNTEGQEAEAAEVEKTEAAEAAEVSGTEPRENIPAYFLIENPSQEYYLTGALTSEDEITVSLEKLTEEENGITDTQEWFSEIGLKMTEADWMIDDNYYYKLVGDDAFYAYLLYIYERESGKTLYCLDFSEYQYTDNIKEGDRDFVKQRVWWAQSVGDVLYVAIGHYTYTESCPHTGYLVAIDLNDMSVIWKSEPCVTNVRRFEILDNTIVCGYGFTSEPDYLILVDRLDGSVIEKIPIRSMAEYIIYKDDFLFVRTYNTNYTFRINREIECR